MKSDLDNTNAIIRKFEPMLKGLSYRELTILNKIVVNKLRLVQKAATLVSMSHFNVGDRVSWDGGDGMARIGIVIRLNENSFS
jgi:hypothetical protein